MVGSPRSARPSFIFAATTSTCSSWIARPAACWWTRARPSSRAGLKLRDFDLDIVNRFNDRLYFATSSGMIVCMRETGHVQPRPLKDPKAPPFGYVPPEGLKPTPPAAAARRAGDCQPKDDAAAPGQTKRHRRRQAKEPADEQVTTLRRRRSPSLSDRVSSLRARLAGPREGAFVGSSVLRVTSWSRQP